MREPIVELEDEDFLYHVAAAEAEALSAKRRKISITTAAEEKKAAEGVYTAALKGSKSVLFQQQSSIRSNRGLKLVAAGNNHNMFASPEFGGGGGGIPAAGDGGSCFKCGKTGHWARDCGDYNSKSYGIDAAAGGGGSCFKCGKSGHWARDCGDSNSNFNSNVIDHSVPEKACPCGIGTCLVLTANTDKNRGRKFYKCHVREENGGCGFFEWCDKDEGTNTLTLGSQSLASNPGVPDLSCPCGAGSCLILTAKTGKNIGQAVYRCPANQGSSCGFFKWCHDQTAANSPSNEASKKGFGIRSGSSCFRCGKDGHWAKDCILPSMQNPAYQGGRSG